MCGVGSSSGALQAWGCGHTCWGPPGGSTREPSQGPPWARVTRSLWGAGYRVQEACGELTGTLCVPCDPGTYTAHLNGLSECLQCRVCDPGKNTGPKGYPPPSRPISRCGGCAHVTGPGAGPGRSASGAEVCRHILQGASGLCPPLSLPGVGSVPL